MDIQGQCYICRGGEAMDKMNGSPLRDSPFDIAGLFAPYIKPTCCPRLIAFRINDQPEFEQIDDRRMRLNGDGEFHCFNCNASFHIKENTANDVLMKAPFECELHAREQP